MQNVFYKFRRRYDLDIFLWDCMACAENGLPHAHAVCVSELYVITVAMHRTAEVCNRIAVSAPVVSGTPQYRDPQWKTTHFRYGRTRSLHLTTLSVFIVYWDKNDNSVILYSTLVMPCAIFLSFLLHRLKSVVRV